VGCPLVRAANQRSLGGGAAWRKRQRPVHAGCEGRKGTNCLHNMCCAALRCDAPWMRVVYIFTCGRSCVRPKVVFAVDRFR